ncbi:TPA: hypothetical protein HH295_05990 [Xanthomonas vasicola pv. zeae]|uniref:Uncharacterized protein n=1 Tax=Xanthomonas vasicola pv. vasculorum TaxID=325776 RepID=A0AAE8F9K2_XANVA|nr:hypothetical protein C7V42_20585 [Xanthomonas vasicola pv. vasculorum]KFA36908.1 hypothetical protein KWI_0108085 [Xanthomonas vasicola pv. vasculorum NCPPB 206]TWQ19143.1 hypothetical protein FQK00_21110 [Xanthomonas vasicola]HHZ22338.1 hypothetical protein [Xanthomonas vasicola pv. zeae]AZM72885.1 hypothetical protein CXP37_20885 [Xanthomonas vasicola pv. vasculorum]
MQSVGSSNGAAAPSRGADVERPATLFVLLHNAALNCTAQQSHRARYTRIGCASAHRRTRHRPAR